MFFCLTFLYYLPNRWHIKFESSFGDEAFAILIFVSWFCNAFLKLFDKKGHQWRQKGVKKTSFLTKLASKMASKSVSGVPRGRFENQVEKRTPKIRWNATLQVDIFDRKTFTMGPGRPLDRPKSSLNDFSIVFGSILEPIFHEKYIKKSMHFSYLKKSWKLMKKTCFFNGFFH